MGAKQNPSTRLRARERKTKKKIPASSVRGKIPVYLYVVWGFIILLSTLAVFMLIHKEPASIYVSPENPKQGDTIFIRVKTDAPEVVGRLENPFDTAQGGEGLVFYKKGTGEWISFLGIDADQKPGDYKIFVDTSKAEHLTKDIKIGLANFSSQKAAQAPVVSTNGTTQVKAVDNIVKKDSPSIKKFLSKFTPTPYFTAPFSFPLNKIEKVGYSFGKFIEFAKNTLQHFGVDLKAPEKTDVYAVNDGKVVATLDLSNYGKTVIIDHGLDIFSLYLHLEEFKVSQGQMVMRGQEIGLSGETGYVTAPHLHFSIRVGASRVDPITFINTTQKLNENFFLADITNAFLNIFNFR
jgi:murein DD-endopeptidase MepM/ murein hydrolase activator NlpD